MKTILISLSILIIMGCATAHRINSISPGMTKEEVIKIMGPPVSVSAKDGVEYLNYKLSETGNDAFMGWATPYFIRIINGRVDAYGRMGDFDSTKIPEIKSTIDLNITK